jgi:hypothetical protein
LRALGGAQPIEGLVAAELAAVQRALAALHSTCPPTSPTTSR